MRRLTKKQRAELMAHDYIKYLRYLIELKREKIAKLTDELWELESELNEKQGYKTLEDLGVDY